MPENACEFRRSTDMGRFAVVAMSAKPQQSRLDSTLALSEGTHDAKDRRGVGSSAV